jgi:hypothetical protein
MRGQDQRFAVQQPGQCQIVGEEIDGVDMDDVAIVQMVQHGWCERIATSTPIGYPDHLYIVDDFASRQGCVVAVEDAVQGDHPDLVPGASLFAAQISGEAFQPAESGMILSGNMGDFHIRPPWCRPIADR